MKDELSNIEPLAKGGQKQVYSATHPEYGDVVLKHIYFDIESHARTRREIRAVQLIAHPSVPKIIGHNCDEDSPGFLWIVEERINGLTLQQSLQTGRKFNINEIVRFLDTMLSICIRAEEQNLVHRDIKPQNIIVDINDTFWLLDFGIARHLDLESLTASNEAFGLFTLGYASSEQFKNLKKDIDIRADLFSIGVVCYEMIKGVNFYMLDANNDPIRVIKKLENQSLPPLQIEGDTQYQLSAFISILGDHRRTRRPQTAKEALAIFNTLKLSLRLN